MLSVYRFVAEEGIKSTKNHRGTLLEHIDFNTWVTISIQRAIDKIHSHLSGGLAFLATVGSTAPFRGFIIGTVRHLSCVNGHWRIGQPHLIKSQALWVKPSIIDCNWFSRGCSSCAWLQLVNPS